MIQVFDEAPQGLQHAPHEARLTAAGYSVAVREVDFTHVDDKEGLMLAFLRGLGLTEHFGRNWDALFDVLTDPGQFSGRLALLLCDYVPFRARHASLAAELETVLLDAQAVSAREGRHLWLLVNEPDNHVL